MLSARKYENVIALNLDDTIPDYLSFAFPKDSELVDVFNNFLLKLRETGVLAQIHHRWGTEANSNLRGSAHDSATTLGFENLSFPFAGLATGIVLGIAITVAETLASCQSNMLTRKSKAHSSTSDN